MIHTSVAFIIFNRPDTAARVFAEIARAKPKKLFVIADGPRADHPDDVARCAATRAVVERVDWDCEVLKNYSDINLGCGVRPATGISWVFEQVDKAIILEDDCVPHPSFFRFCEELLDKYTDDERVMQVSGNNFQFGHKRTSYSYFFSCHNICAGGWATWRRAWKYFDAEVTSWPELCDSKWLLDIVYHSAAAEYWCDKFQRAYDSRGDIHFWDYQWTFACWVQNGLSILPNVTLLSNIGFREDATHTKSPSVTANLQTNEMIFPLIHPPYVLRNADADHFLIEQLVLPRRSLLYQRLYRKVYSSMPMLVRKPLSRLRSKLISLGIWG
jgi:hypothetical protein